MEIKCFQKYYVNISAILDVNSSLFSLSSFMYAKNAWLVHLPCACISLSEKPLFPISEATPLLKECGFIIPSVPSVIGLVISVSILLKSEPVNYLWPSIRTGMPVFNVTLDFHLFQALRGQQKVSFGKISNFTPLPTLCSLGLLRWILKSCFSLPFLSV